MLNILLVSLLPVGALGVIVLASLKPKIKPLSQEELKESAQYYNRINRKGVMRAMGLTPVIEVGQAREQV